MPSKIAVVTGGLEEGIGRAVTNRMLEDGYAVVVSHEPATAPTDDDQKRDGLTLVQVDHGDRADLDRLSQRASSQGEVSALINAQFYFEMENPENFDFKIWDRSLAVNLTAPNFLYHSLRPAFADAASVVTITSTEGFMGSFGASAYAATKAAIHNLTKTLANNGSDKGIRVNAVAAGWIGGVMDTDDVFNMSRSITPLKRLGDAAEVAGAVSFLCSSDASFVNGSVVTVDGGYSGVDTISKFEFESSKGSGS